MFLIFNNTREVIRAEKFLRAAEIRVSVKPLPRELSADCGMCLHTEEALEKVDAVLVSAEIQYKVGESIS